ncbi:hypothetical protein [[Eubacterium] cellulosolvens]
MNLKFRSLPRWRKVELAQSLFGLVIIAMVISTSVYYYYVPQAEASKEQSRTLKMAIGSPYSKGIHAIADTVIPIKIWVIDEHGDFDRTRNDVIEVTLAPSKILELNQSKINLVQGEATLEVYAISEGSDNVLLTAVWVSGESYLPPTSILIVYPPMGSPVH